MFTTEQTLAVKLLALSLRVNNGSPDKYVLQLVVEAFTKEIASVVVTYSNPLVKDLELPSSVICSAFDWSSSDGQVFCLILAGFKFLEFNPKTNQFRLGEVGLSAGTDIAAHMDAAEKTPPLDDTPRPNDDLPH